MSNQYFNVIVEKDSDGYLVASVPALKGCHTQAKSYDQLMERIQEAIELCLEMENEEFEPLEFVGVQRIAVRQ
ncbi:MAG: type II toxin-antitoxin system HicB family antitoxin [Snowella sp.]|nr:type II toxin-antitoxin system HicB family antitoxin [Snowella sp.]